MKPETEQLLGTLEVLYDGQILFWETSTQGEFNFWNLMISEGFVNLTDLELAFDHWQNIEHWGTPTNQQAFGDDEYAPLRSEREDDWNESIATERQGYYQQLQQLVTNHLQNLQAYELYTFYTQAHQSFTWQHRDFSVSIVVGETSDRHWFCLAPTVPDQASYHRRKRNQSAQQAAIACEPSSAAAQTLISQIQSLLDNLTPIPIYGYYYGGYNYTYQHQLVGAIAKTKATAIELALSSAAMVILEKPPTVEYAYNSSKISEFMNQCLRDHTLYSLSFWDVAYTYEVGQTPAGDWIGWRSQSEFEYNP